MTIYAAKVAKAAPNNPQYFINIKFKQIFIIAPVPLKIGDQFCFSIK